MKNEDKIVELLTQLVQKQDQLIERMDSKEVADQRRSEAIETALKESLTLFDNYN